MEEDDQLSNISIDNSMSRDDMSGNTEDNMSNPDLLSNFDIDPNRSSHAHGDMTSSFRNFLTDALFPDDDTADGISKLEQNKSDKSFFSDVCPGFGDRSDDICQFGNTSQGLLDRSNDGKSVGQYSKVSPNTDIINKTFPDNILARACAEIARKRPDNPIRYLAFYLMNWDKNRERQKKDQAQRDALLEYKKTLDALSIVSVQEDEIEDLPEYSNLIEEETPIEFEIEPDPLPIDPA